MIHIRRCYNLEIYISLSSDNYIICIIITRSNVHYNYSCDDGFLLCPRVCIIYNSSIVSSALLLYVPITYTLVSSNTCC